MVRWWGLLLREAFVHAGVFVLFDHFGTDWSGRVNRRRFSCRYKSIQLTGFLLMISEIDMQHAASMATIQGPMQPMESTKQTSAAVTQWRKRHTGRRLLCSLRTTPF